MKVYTQAEFDAKKAGARQKGVDARAKHNETAKALVQRLDVATTPVRGYVFGASAPEA